ncbi:DNA methyltransferase, partial [Rothia nasimurium]|uniref:DNA methyltransferase n=1 Tax=Rothia nasimurium TaxID=85336 RepID=UPI00360C1FFE
MAIFDSLVVGEDWISEHFFRTDAKQESFVKQVIDLEKQWKQDDEGGESSWSRFKAARGGLERLLSAVEFDETQVSAGQLPSEMAAVYADIRSALGFGGALLDRATVESVAQKVSFEHAWVAPEGETLVLEAHPVTGVDQLLDSEVSRLAHEVIIHKASGDVTQSWSVQSALSFIFRAEDAPRYVLVLAGHWVLLAEQERWAEGRYLAVNLYLALQRNDQKSKGELAHVLACLGRPQLTFDAQHNIWWDGVLEASVKHTVGVSSELREGIRLSIEILANDVVARLRSQGRGAEIEHLDAQDLARQSLRYLYRILFLLYAEASPEMQVVPAHDPIYEEGYGLDRLRELILVDLHSPEAKQGTHFYQSLDLLFSKVNRGYNHTFANENEEPLLRFEPLEADLFSPAATALIDGTKLSNEELQKVLANLLMTKAGKNKERGFISYADLGINQLGAVYEGLMSYTGFIATERLYEVAKDGKAEGGSWVVNQEKADDLIQAGFEKSFVTRDNEDTGLPERVVYEPGTFVFRLAGRERQQSASYYTPEVLTKFVVSQALEELIDDETPADDLLKLSVCEPALGSGAFVVEATRQLATEYLKRKQKETGQTIEPDRYAEEYQKVKAQIALHQVYGVDLNATAVELAEISLWLDTMNPGLHAPWFGLHLRRGNSLIGARRAVYSEAELVRRNKQKLPKVAYWNEHEPTAVPATGLAAAIDEHQGLSVTDPATAGKVFQFVLPSNGWAAVGESKALKDSKLALDEQKALKSWVAKLPKLFKQDEFNQLVDLSERAEELWGITLQRMRVAERESSRRIDYFGAPEVAYESRVHRQAIEAKLGEAGSAYRRLRRVMDAWCALWFWPVDAGETTLRASQQEFDAYRRKVEVEAGLKPDMGGYDATGLLNVVQQADGSYLKTVKVLPPSFDEWMVALRELMGSTLSKKARQTERFTATIPSDWAELDAYEGEVLLLSGAQPVEAVLERYPWLRVCEQIAQDQGFFHWELDFAAVFARGGFDLQVGNPPWVRPRWDENAIMAEHHPWWQLANKATNADKSSYVNQARQDPTHTRFFTDSATGIAATSEFLSHKATYPLLNGLQPDLYRAFMVKTWQNNSGRGVVSLIHPESHFTEKKAAQLRSAAYHRLRRHWHFVNELQLFEIDHHNPFGIHIYSGVQTDIRFDMAASLYHPDTVTKLTAHGTYDFVPALKDDKNNWDTRPHPERIVTVDLNLLATWASILDEPGTPADQARMVYAVNKGSSEVLKKLSVA